MNNNIMASSVTDSTASGSSAAAANKISNHINNNSSSHNTENNNNNEVNNNNNAPSETGHNDTEHSNDVKNLILKTSNALNLDFGKMSIEDVYNLARNFIKAKDGTKALHLSYHERNLMNVLTKQINHRKLEDERNKVGFLDLVGKDRLQLWKGLGDLSREDAMKKYIDALVKVCPLFSAHLEANKRHLEEEEEKKLKLIEEELKLKEMSEQKEKKLKEEDLKLLEENKKRREEIQRKQIQEALNQQTYPHFKAYAEQQHPNNVQAQEELIKQLQEQHFEQYMNQVYQQQLLHQQQQAEQLRAMRRAQRKQEQSTEDQLKRLSLNSNGNTISVNENSSTQSTQSLQSTSSPSSQLNAIINPNTTNNINNNNNNLLISNSNSLNPNLNNTNLINSNSSASVSHETINLTLITEKETHKKSNNNDPSLQININNNKSLNLSNNNSNSNANLSNNGETLINNSNNNVNNNNSNENTTNNADEEDDEDDDIELPPISAASMITRKDIKEFKESVRRDNDAIIKVGSGETVTVRVPTHEDGRLIFWEFASDYYDLGFGLYFEWTISPSSNVTVHVSDSSEDEEGDEEADPNKQDVEKGDKATDNKPPCDEIIPIFRRDCHEEVYAGSHLYPGRGVYLLKFDNSYSLWRSKTLYYRVYYSK